MGIFRKGDNILFFQFLHGKCFRFVYIISPGKGIKGFFISRSKKVIVSFLFHAPVNRIFYLVFLIPPVRYKQSAVQNHCLEIIAYRNILISSGVAGIYVRHLAHQGIAVVLAFFLQGGQRIAYRIRIHNTVQVQDRIIRMSAYVAFHVFLTFKQECPESLFFYRFVPTGNILPAGNILSAGNIPCRLFVTVGNVPVFRILYGFRRH